MGRAGFYSYELLERIGGIPVTNLESFVMEQRMLRTVKRLAEISNN